MRYITYGMRAGVRGKKDLKIIFSKKIESIFFCWKKYKSGKLKNHNLRKIDYLKNEPV